VDGLTVDLHDHVVDRSGELGEEQLRAKSETSATVPERAVRRVFAVTFAR